MGGFFADTLDMRAAYTQGWAFALPLMVKANSVYRDSSGAGQSVSDDFDAEPNAVPNAGWYNPNSIAGILYDLWDAANDGMDVTTLPFSTLHNALVDAKGTHALMTIYPFVNALLVRDPTDAANVTALVLSQNITVNPGDDFGTLETNDGGDPQNLPLYRPISPQPVAVPTTQEVHSIADADTYFNGLGVRRYFVMTLPVMSGQQVRLTGDPGSYPAVVAYQDGLVLSQSDNLTPPQAPGPNQRLTLDDLAAGTYVLEVYESANVFPDDPAGDTGDARIRIRVVQ
jgi:hypothetical protein